MPSLSLPDLFARSELAQAGDRLLQQLLNRRHVRAVASRTPGAFVDRYAAPAPKVLAQLRSLRDLESPASSNQLYTVLSNARSAKSLDDCADARRKGERVGRTTNRAGTHRSADFGPERLGSRSRKQGAFK